MDSFTIPEEFKKSALPLWAGPAPYSLGAADRDIPTLNVFLPDKPGGPAPAVIVCPGGGYEMLAFHHEGIAEAGWFQQRGMAAFILKYRLPVHGYRHPVPLLDAQRAMRLVRSRAAEWNIDPARVGVMGFSAGGHLVTTLETHFDSGNPGAPDPVDRHSCRPDFAVPVYALISMKGDLAHRGSLENLLGPKADPALIENLSNETQVTPQTPPTLLVHAVDDDVVSIEHSRIMYAALQKAGVSTRLDEYPTGRHGFGFGPCAPQDRIPPGWLDKVGEWLKSQGFMA